MATEVVNIVRRGSGGIWTLVRKIFSINFFIIILVLVFIYLIIASVQQQSLEPLVTGVGGKAFFSLNDLNIDSLKILDEGYSSLPRWNKFMLLLSIAGSFMFIFIWIKLLAAFIGRSFFGGDLAMWFANWSVAVAFFIFLEVIFVLFAGSQGYLGEGFEPNQALTLPWEAVKNFGRSLPIIIKPILDIWDKISFQSGSIWNKTIKNLTSNQTGNIGNLSNLTIK